MVDPIRTGRTEVQSDAARMEMVEALRQGNIYEVMRRLPAGLTPRDFEDYMGDQWKTWKSEILQDSVVYSAYAAMPEPSINQFAMHEESAGLSHEQAKDFFKSMTVSLGKSAKAVEGVEGGTASGAELSDMAEGTLDEWESFTNDMWGQIFDAQMMQDYESRMGEVQKEVDEIIAMAKSGSIDPEYVLIALAKLNVAKNGVLMTWIGKKAFMTNETMNNVANELKLTPSSDPQYFGKLQDAQAKTRDGSFQLNMLMQDMQKIMQDVAGVLEQVHSYMGEINRTRNEIITKVAAR